MKFENLRTGALVVGAVVVLGGKDVACEIAQKCQPDEPQQVFSYRALDIGAFGPSMMVTGAASTISASVATGSSNLG